MKKRRVIQPGPGKGRGVVIRHSRRCVVKHIGLDSRCTCGMRFAAWVYRDKKKHWRTFATYSEAAAWRRKASETAYLIGRVEVARAEYHRAVQALRDHAANLGVVE